MNAKEVLNELTRLEIHITIKEDNLSLTPPDDYTISPELLENIKINKKAIITILSSNLYQEPSPLVPISRDKDIPLSFAQQRLWFINQFEEGSDTSYNLPWALRLTGKLDITALQKTFQTIVDRHESLRTTFQTVEGKAVQIIADKISLDFPVTKVTEAEVSNYTYKNTTHVFDLSTGPLITVALLQLTTEEHILLINMHHIISDGWSDGVLIREIMALYGAYAKGEPSPLVPLPVQYADFSIWQRGWLQGSVLKQHIEYWKQQLGGAPALLELPTDYPRPAKQTTYGAMEAFQIPKALSDQVITFARKERVTLFMLLMTTFQILLSRYSGQTDICVGTPIANRKQSALHDLIGFFVNTLVIRTHVDSQQSFKALLKQVRSASLAAFRHQDLPFEQVIEVVNPARNMSHSPLFQVVFALHNTDNETLTLDNIAISSEHSELQTTQFDLTLNLSETNQGLSGGVVYNTDLFNATTIKRLIQHFQMLLTGIIENPEQKLFNLPLHSPQEQQKILYEWNNNNTDFPQNICIHTLFEIQAEKAPKATAVTYEEQQLTYQTLNERSNQLAHYLIEQGVGPESKVGLCVKRSLEMVIGLLAVLKAGGAYVPIDPEYPAQRINHLISDSNIVLLLTQKKLLDSTLAQTDNPVFCFDRDENILTKYSARNPTIPVYPLNLAYIIYTSGSTGKPKGVAVPHRSLVKLCHWHQQTFVVTAASRATQLAGIGFDAMAWEVWPYLTAGAQLLLVQPDLVLMPGPFIEWIESEAITHCFVPTPLTEKLLTETWPTICQLQYLLTGGDKLNRLTSTNLPFKLINNYGPTEVTVVATSGEINPQDTSTPFLGRPISNTCVYILDSDFNLVPIGVPGELFVGNAGLARGYLNRTDLTAEKFIPDPFTSTPGQRLYRSGDLVRYQPDGNIDFVGRADDQVKIRGFRIELSEIENVLNEQVGVSNALVLALSRDDSDQTHFLTAYLTPEQDKQLDKDQLQTALQAILPSYMVPSFFVVLEQWPLTENGKINKKALPIPDAAELQTHAYVAPRTDIEKQAVTIWAQVLNVKVDQVGIYSNFFELGGNSLLTIPVTQEMKAKLGIELSIKDFYNEGNISGLLTLSKKEPPKNDIVSINEADLDQDITPCGKIALNTPPKVIFLTGSTGFVGRFLLAELLNKTEATIYCLVRAESDADGDKRLRQKMTAWNLWHNAYESRVIAVSGDLSSPKLGIEKTTYDTLCRSVDMIIHNGTYMNHMDTYDTMKKANVDGLKHLIRLACTTKQKMIQYMSTTGVFNSPDPGSSSVNENSPVDTQVHYKTHGYSATKWVAENVLINAKDRGIPSNIYRLGLVSGDTEYGRSDEDQWFTRLLKIFITLGCSFDDNGSRWLPLTPVDFVANAIVALTLSQHQDAIFHITNPKFYSLNDLVEQYNAVSKPPLKLKTYQGFIALVKQYSSNDKQLPFVPLIHSKLFDDKDFLFSVTPLLVESTKTIGLLNKKNIKIPDISNEIFINYLIYIGKGS